MKALLQERTQPTIARFFESAKVTREALSDQALMLARGRALTAQIAEWTSGSVETLVEILEKGAYAPPMTLEIASDTLVDHIWDLHRDELTLDHCRRLGALVGGPRLDQEASDHLALDLAALAGDVARIRALCDDAIGRRESWEAGVRPIFEDRLLSCVVHLQLGDDAILYALVQTVSTPGTFGPRFRAMVALGSLKPAVGTPAADVIEQHIYESRPAVAAVRRLVLERLRSSPESWVVCRKCCHGSVHGQSGWGSGDRVACPECLGLGVVRQEAGSILISDGPS